MRCVLQPYGQQDIVCGSVGMLLLPKAELRAVAGGLMAILFRNDSGVANHKPNARAVDGCSHLAQVGDAEA